MLRKAETLPSANRETISPRCKNDPEPSNSPILQIPDRGNRDKRRSKTQTQLQTELTWIKGSTTHHWQPVAIFILEIKHKISLYLSYNLTSSFGGKQKEWQSLFIQRNHLAHYVTPFTTDTWIHTQQQVSLLTSPFLVEMCLLFLPVPRGGCSPAGWHT